ncbi:alpha/beta hydrolase [Hymenobacter sp. IS2118]|uniref:alpha/beta hydrolase n=1 Tax=Hymenobacter sp. IS2118 TaxID=1505605 RepID=UPI000A45FB21|nr:alpha/beta hydrolase-fold protein [Hymenobacter sp. IS2118]
MSRLHLSILLLLFALLAAGGAMKHAVVVATAAEPLVIGQTFTIQSKVLDETRRLNVYLPPAYTDSATLRLPVLYMPDGGMQEDFLHVAGLVQVLVGNGTMRPFVLVGIENTQRRRDLTGPTTNAKDREIALQVGGSAAYRQFIREELMPEVRRRYRTTAETAIVGESLAGLFVVETLLLEPTLFDTCLAFDPSLWWNNGQLAAQAGPLPKAPAGKTRQVYLATSSQGDIKATRQLAKVLNSGSAPAATCHYEHLPQETHATIYHPAALKALRVVFGPRAEQAGSGQ